ncbi:hypothetical protein FKM82_020582 [Ascaphus truei]
MSHLERGLHPNYVQQLMTVVTCGSSCIWHHAGYCMICFYYSILHSCTCLTYPHHIVQYNFIYYTMSLFSHSSETRHLLLYNIAEDIMFHGKK